MIGWLIAAGCVAGWLGATRLVQARFDERYLTHATYANHFRRDCLCNQPAQRLVLSALLGLIFPLTLVGVAFLSRPTKPIRQKLQAERDAAELKQLREIAQREGLPL